MYLANCDSVIADVEERVVVAKGWRIKAGASTGKEKEETLNERSGAY